jgi:hypothetical protein
VAERWTSSRPGRASALVAVSAALALSACEPLSAEELGRELETVGSLAAEGSVLAEEVARQETKRTFARVHARELADSAEHSAERLTDAHAADGLNDEVTQARGLADRVSAAIGEVEVAPDDASGAARAAAILRRLSHEADRLAGEL